MFDDILGLTLEKGLKVVKDRGFNYKVNKYLPPRRSSDDFELSKGRIVRVRLLEEKTIEITLCDLTTPF